MSAEEILSVPSIALVPVTWRRCCLVSLYLGLEGTRAFGEYSEKNLGDPWIGVVVCVGGHGIADIRNIQHTVA